MEVEGRRNAGAGAEAVAAVAAAAADVPGIVVVLSSTRYTSQ